MNIKSNFSLKAYNTFGIDVKARQFIQVNTVEELKEVLKKLYASEMFILGGGSNMLLTKDVEQTVIHINLKGKKVVSETKNHVIVQAMAGENWHEFVLYCLENNYGGLENLSLIPGNVGTAPIQNIGAYGVEIKDTFESCTALNLQTLEIKTFSIADCEFGYRDSVFKNSAKGKYIIISVNFKLTKNEHQINTSYGAIDQYLEEQGIKNPSLSDVSNAVIAIRESKLPNPEELGNSGSFFKNPIVNREDLNRLLKKFPKMPFYELDEETIKVPAGWLIDQAGLRGFRKGDAGVHKKQALVLVNYGTATGAEILALSEEVQEKVKEKFNIEIQPEVNIF